MKLKRRCAFGAHGKKVLAIPSRRCNLVICPIEVAAETGGGEGLRVLVAGAGASRASDQVPIRASLKVG